MNTSRITRPVELTFDGWVWPYDINCTVTWAYDPGCRYTSNGDGWPPSLDIASVKCEDDAATVFASVVESWMEEFPDTPCPFTIASVAQALEDATEQVADAVDLSDLED